MITLAIKMSCALPGPGACAENNHGLVHKEKGPWTVYNDGDLDLLHMARAMTTRTLSNPAMSTDFGNRTI